MGCFLLKYLSFSANKTRRETRNTSHPALNSRPSWDDNSHPLLWPPASSLWSFSGVRSGRGDMRVHPQHLPEQKGDCWYDWILAISKHILYWAQWEVIKICFLNHWWLHKLMRTRADEDRPRTRCWNILTYMPKPKQFSVQY